MTNKKALLDLFKPKTTTITVKAWNDLEVTIKELSVNESNDIQSLMLKDSTIDELSSGTVNISIGKLEEAKLRAVSAALVDPKLTPAELDSMSSSAKDGISEIYEAIKDMEKPDSKK